MYGAATVSADTRAHESALVGGLRVATQLAQWGQPSSSSSSSSSSNHQQSNSAEQPLSLSEEFCALQSDDTSFLTRALDVLRSHADEEAVVTECMVFAAALAQVRVCVSVRVCDSPSWLCLCLCLCLYFRASKRTHVVACVFKFIDTEHCFNILAQLHL